MSFDEHEDLRWLPPGEQVLVQRLRGLEWPRPDADLRERCWREFHRRVSELDGDRPPADAHRFLHDYSRRAPLGRGVVATHRLAAAGSLTRPITGWR